MTSKLPMKIGPRGLVASKSAQEGAGDAATDPLYSPFFCEHIKYYARRMMFPEEWADQLGVTEATMAGWLTRYPDFAKAYAEALTSLRATFTAALRRAALMPSMNRNAQLLVLIAKQRFPDLYANEVRARSPQASAPKMRDAPPKDLQNANSDISPTGTGIQHTSDLQNELDALRRRQGGALN